MILTPLIILLMLLLPPLLLWFHARHYHYYAIMPTLLIFHFITHYADCCYYLMPIILPIIPLFHDIIDDITIMPYYFHDAAPLRFHYYYCCHIMPTLLLRCLSLLFHYSLRRHLFHITLFHHDTRHYAILPPFFTTPLWYAYDCAIDIIYDIIISHYYYYLPALLLLLIIPLLLRLTIIHWITITPLFRHFTFSHFAISATLLLFISIHAIITIIIFIAIMPYFHIIIIHYLLLFVLFIIILPITLRVTARLRDIWFIISLYAAIIAHCHYYYWCHYRRITSIPLLFHYYYAVSLLFYFRRFHYDDDPFFMLRHYLCQLITTPLLLRHCHHADWCLPIIHDIIIHYSCHYCWLIHAIHIIYYYALIWHDTYYAILIISCWYYALFITDHYCHIIITIISSYYFHICHCHYYFHYMPITHYYWLFHPLPWRHYYLHTPPLINFSRFTIHYSYHIHYRFRYYYIEHYYFHYYFIIIFRLQHGDAIVSLHTIRWLPFPRHDYFMAICHAISMIRGIYDCWWYATCRRYFADEPTRDKISRRCRHCRCFMPLCCRWHAHYTPSRLYTFIFILLLSTCWPRPYLRCYRRYHAYYWRAIISRWSIFMLMPSPPLFV